MNALELHDVVVRFGALRAVDGASLTLAPGERRAVIGPNGAGKTTLFNAITGVRPPDEGRVLIDGWDATRASPQARARRGVGRTFQITNLFPELTVAENMRVALRGLTGSKWNFWSTDRATGGIAEALAAARLEGVEDTPVKNLSYGAQRQLELAMSLVQKPRLLLLDEPAAGLSPAERGAVADIVRALPRDIAMVLIEHDMDLALGLVDSVTVMHEGRVLLEAPPDAIRGNPRVQEVYFRARRLMLNVRDLHAGYGEAQVLHGVSLNVEPGQVHALLGRNGMGKTTLVRAMMGLANPRVTAGEVRLGGARLTGMPPHQIARAGVALVPQGRRLFASLTVIEHLTMLKPAHARTGWTVARVMDAFPRLAERRQHRGNQLSGGERQMLAVGRALMADPAFILMDEPSEGLAPVMVQALEGVVGLLRDEGLGILLVEQNLFSALAVADRVSVMEGGAIVHAGSRADSPAELLTRFLGVH